MSADRRPGGAPTARQRYLALDGVRFLAAFVIVLHHIDVYTMDWLGHDGTISTRTHLVVDIFFALSGFVLMHTYGHSVRGWDGFGRFMRKRLARIYPLHVLTLIAAAAVVLVRARVAGEPAGWELAQAPLQLGLLHATGLTETLALNRPSWSISAEFLCYLLFPVLALVLGRRSPAAAVATAFGMAGVLTLADGTLATRGWTEWSHDYGVLRAVPSFVLGIAACRWLEAHPPSRIRGRHAYAALAAYAIGIAIAPQLLVVLSTGLVVGILAAAEAAGRAGRLAAPVMARLGDLSYGTYMWHFPIVVAVMAVARRLSPEGGLVPVAGATLVIVVATLVAAHLSFTRFEAPMRRWLRGGRRRTTPRAGRRRHHAGGFAVRDRTAPATNEGRRPAAHAGP